MSRGTGNFQRRLGTFNPLQTLTAYTDKLSALGQKQTCAVQLGMSDLGQQQTYGSFDDFVGYRNHARRNSQAECLSSRRVYDELEFC